MAPRRTVLLVLQEFGQVVLMGLRLEISQRTRRRALAGLIQRRYAKMQ